MRRNIAVSDEVEHLPEDDEESYAHLQNAPGLFLVVASTALSKMKPSLVFSMKFVMKSKQNVFLVLRLFTPRIQML